MFETILLGSWVCSVKPREFRCDLDFLHKHAFDETSTRIGPYELAFC